MKTLKISEQTHKKLMAIKVEGGFKTLDEAISNVISWIIPTPRKYIFDDEHEEKENGNK